MSIEIGLNWREIRNAYPPPHARYLVNRDNVIFTATPCYGLHDPGWVVKTLTGETAPEKMLPDDKWTCPPPRKEQRE